MNSSTLCIYDISDRLKLPNPSAKLRKYGVRPNLSAWVFPSGCIPVGILDDLKSKGAVVHLLRFSEGDWDEVVRLAVGEVHRHARKVWELVESRCGSLKNKLMGMEPSGELFQDNERLYKKWRGLISKGKRELLAAEQCVIGFGITRDCEQALDGLRRLLKAELESAMAWRDTAPSNLVTA